MYKHVDQLIQLLYEPCWEKIKILRFYEFNAKENKQLIN